MIETKIPCSPVLLIVFNRPDYTEQTFAAIREARPEKLYIAMDAPRSGNRNDEANCKRVKEIIEKVDWPCDVKYKIASNNLGCGYGPYSAINWIFEHEDRAIILEDDCVASPAFFKYCDYLLEKYKDDLRIHQISGRSHQSGSRFFKDKDYLFSKYAHTWGWATWRRCWQNMDMDFKSLEMFLSMGGAENTLSSKSQGRFFNKLLGACYKEKLLNSHVWDMQWMFVGMSSCALSIVPAKNLIKNVGVVGTHSRKSNKFIDMTSCADYKISNEPHFVMWEREYEELHFRNHIKKIFPPIYVRAFRKLNSEVFKALQHIIGTRESID